MHKSWIMTRARESGARLFLLGGFSRASSLPPAVGAALLSCVVLLATGCATTEETRQAVAGYAQAMEQVERSTTMFLDDFSDGLKMQRELERVAGAQQAPARPPYPTAFVPPSDPNVPQTEADKALVKNRQALVVMRQYSDMLLALAEGHSEQEIRTRATRLGSAVETLSALGGATIPGVAALTALVPKIIKLAQDAANRQQLENAVNEGRKSVYDILLHLEGLTPDMYRLSIVGTKQAEQKLQTDILRVARALKLLVERHGPPIDPGLAGRMATLQGQLADIGTKTEMLSVMPIPLPYTAGKPAYDAAASAESDIFMQSLRATTEKYQELIAKQNAYYDLLTKYVLTLREAGRSLDNVAASLAKPVDLSAEVARLLKVSFELRDAMNAYRNPAAATR